MSNWPAAPERVSKRTLITVSHAIERAAVAVTEDAPMVVFALFQRVPYLRREQLMYERIAGSAAVTVMGAVGATPDPPAGVEVVDLDPDDPLAIEWTVVVLTPRFGAALVARDQEQVEPTAATLEDGRLFDGWWRFHRDEAFHEAVRLRNALGGALSRSSRAVVDRVLERVRDLPAAAGEGRAEASIRLFADRVEQEYQRGLAARRQHDPRRSPTPGPSGDPVAAVGDEQFLRRWTGADRTTASGTLPLALVAVRLAVGHRLPGAFARRVDTAAMIELIRLVTPLLREVDRIVRTSDDDLLLVMPSLSHDDAVGLAYRVTEQVAAQESLALGTASVATVVTVTRARPLPLGELTAALDWAVAEGVRVATLPDPATAATIG